ncbi:MAG: 30S ribosomal protein S6 [Puniceicoccaceae bacterium]
MTATKRHYRATFILDTRSYEGSVDDLITRLSQMIQSIGGEALETENLGTKNFVRSSRKGCDSGIYLNITFDGPPDAPAQIHEKTRLDRTVDRVLVEILASR